MSRFLLLCLALALPMSAIAGSEEPAWVEHARVLLDDRAPDDVRAAAADALATTGDAGVIPFLRAAARLRDPEVRAAALRAAVAFDHPDAVALGEVVARDELAPTSVRLAAMDLLRDVQREDAGRVLFAIADERASNAAIRRHAREAFEQGYPQLAAAMQAPRVPVEPIGAAAGIVANGVAGGVLLSSVGTWGKLDEAEAIGAVGGGLIGLGTGWLYTTAQPVSDGQGLTYASGVGWGLSSGLLAQWAIVPRDHPDIGDRTRRNVGAGLRVLGTAGGATVGALAMRSDPDPVDVLEVDLAGYTGSQIGWGISRLALGQDPDYWSSGMSSDDIGRDLARRDRIRTFSTLAGAGVGLGLGAAVRRDWDLEPGDALMAAVVAGESAWIGGWMPEVLDLADEPDGHIHTATHLGLGLGLGLTALGETPPRRGAMAAYGAVAGNALGAGLPMLASKNATSQDISRVMVPMGAAGTVGGALLSEWLDPSAGDWSMVGVGVPLIAAEAGAIGVVLDDRGVLDGVQPGGLGLVAGGTAAAGLMTLGHFVEPEPGDMALLGASAAWGGWYGVMLPLALDLELSEADHVLFTTVTADVFLAGGGVLISPLVDLEPKRTLGPQLGGVAGATLFALGTGLATDDGQAVTGMALVGSTVGLGTGAVASELWRKKRGTRTTTAALPRLRVPGEWAPTAAPVVLEDGSTVLVFGVTGVGW